MSAPARPPRPAPARFATLPPAPTTPPPAPAPTRARRRRSRSTQPAAAPAPAAPADAVAPVLATLVATLDSAALSRLDRFRAAVELLYSEGARIGLSEDKARLGGINEALVALERGHTLSTSLHGADSTDAAAQTHEQKNSDVKASRGFKANFVYKQPERDAGETDDAYVRRIRAHWHAKSSGTHILSTLRGTRVVKSYEIASEFMADYMAEWARAQLVDAQPGTPLGTHNLGSLPCQRCGEYRRVAALVAHGATYAQTRAQWTPWRWRALFTTSVRRNCEACAPN